MVAAEFGNEQSLKDKAAFKKTAQKKPKIEVEEEPAVRELIIKNADAAIFAPKKPVVAAPKVVDKIDLDAVSGKAAAKGKAEKVKEEALPKKGEKKEEEEPKAAPAKVEKNEKGRAEKKR